MKSINLLTHAFSTHNLENIDLMKYNLIDSLSYKSNVRKKEEDDLKEFIKFLDEYDYKIYEHFYYNFSIPQISKEFDLLRISDDEVINIEIKHKGDLEKIKKQLKANKYYLKVLKIDLNIICFVVESKKLYKLANNEILEIEKDQLLNLLSHQSNFFKGNLEELFEPTQYLISPFNNSKEFLDGLYFLNSQQNEIKKNIYNDIKNKKLIIMLKGSAGSGKTLLAYDIAKSVMKTYKVLIIHCGFLNSGQNYLNINHDWNIFSIRDYKKINYDNYDIVIIDEGQRVDEIQLNFILEKIKKYNKNLIFVYDPEQVLCAKEFFSKSIELVEKMSESKFELSGKIRTNKEILYFIEDLFNLDHKTNYKYQNIKISHYNNIKDAYKFIEYMISENDWNFINYTQSKYAYEEYNYLTTLELSNVHKMVGQECDKVIILLNDKFYYENNKLMSSGWKAPYMGTKMLYEILTRARKEIYLVIVNNIEIYKVILDILVQSEKYSEEYKKIERNINK